MEADLGREIIIGLPAIIASIAALFKVFQSAKELKDLREKVTSQGREIEQLKAENDRLKSENEELTNVNKVLAGVNEEYRTRLLSAIDHSRTQPRRGAND